MYEIKITNLNQVVRLDGNSVADGVWHDVTVAWTSPLSATGEVKLTLDHELSVSEI